MAKLKIKQWEILDPWGQPIDGIRKVRGETLRAAIKATAAGKKAAKLRITSFEGSKTVKQVTGEAFPPCSALNGECPGHETLDMDTLFAVLAVELK